MKAPLLTASLFSTLLTSALAPVAGAQITEDVRLTASDASIFSRYGTATAAHGDRILVGAHGSVASTTPAGAVYLIDQGTGQELMKIEPSNGDPGDFFGQAVALSDDFVLVGSPREDGNVDPSTFFTNSGTAYVFDASTGQELMQLRPSEVLLNAFFSRSVALEGSIGAIGTNAFNAQMVDTGAVYLFDVSTGEELHKLLALDGESDDELGESVAIDGGLVVAGAARDDDNGDESGSAYVFDATTGAQVAKLLPTDGAADDRFGVDVAIDGDRVVVGAWYDDDNGSASGSAYVFDANSGQQIMKLTASDGAANDQFGRSVAISEALILVSAPQNDDGAQSSGSVYVFDRTTGEELAKLAASDAGFNHFFGYDVSLDGNTAVMGSPFSDQNGSATGTAYLFDLEGMAGGAISYCDPANGNSFSSGGAVLTSSGGFGTAQATFNIVNVPDSFGLLFAGNMATDVVLGCGRRCVGGSLIRGSVMMANGHQVLDAPFDMSQAGATHIQYWFRDAGSCGAGMNLSNALTR